MPLELAAPPIMGVSVAERLPELLVPGVEVVEGEPAPGEEPLETGVSVAAALPELVAPFMLVPLLALRHSGLTLIIFQGTKTSLLILRLPEALAAGVSVAEAPLELPTLGV